MSHCKARRSYWIANSIGWVDQSAHHSAQHLFCVGITCLRMAAAGDSVAAWSFHNAEQQDKSGSAARPAQTACNTSSATDSPGQSSTFESRPSNTMHRCIPLLLSSCPLLHPPAKPSSYLSTACFASTWLFMAPEHVPTQKDQQKMCQSDCHDAVRTHRLSI